MSKNSSTTLELVATTVIFCTNFAFFYFNTPRRLDLFDMSAFLDAGYRVYLGQRPYLDFYYQAGPSHLWLLAGSFLLFGFTLNAVIFSVTFCSTLFGLCCYFFSRKTLPPFSSIILSIVFSIIFAGPFSHPWYDLTAYALAVPALLLCHPRLGLKSYLFTGMSGILLSLSFLAKSNIGAISGLWCFIFLLAYSRLNFAVCLSICFLIGSLSFLSIYSIPESIDQCFLSYHVSSRFLDLGRLVFSFIELPYAWTCFAQALIIILSLRTRERDNLLSEGTFGLGVLSIGIFAAWTGSANNSAHTMMSGIQIISLIRSWKMYQKSPEVISRQKLRLVAAACSLTIAYVAIIGIKKSLDLQVWSWKKSNEQTDMKLSTPGFDRWACSSKVCAGLDEVVQFIKSSIPKSESILVIPQSTMIYGMAGRVSYQGVPFIFHSEVHPAPGRIRNLVESKIREAPPEWIVIDDQTENEASIPAMVLNWMGLSDLINQKYLMSREYGSFKILKLKTK